MGRQTFELGFFLFMPVCTDKCILHRNFTIFGQDHLFFFKKKNHPYLPTSSCFIHLFPSNGNTDFQPHFPLCSTRATPRRFLCIIANVLNRSSSRPYEAYRLLRHLHRRHSRRPDQDGYVLNTYTFLLRLSRPRCEW